MGEKKQSFLKKINSPKDLKALTFEQLNQLANEIREFLIKVVSQTGGHLAPNLGVVELTIALHYALESPKDKIIWDVGHQSYVHKIITGRKDKFSTLRQYQGLCGFPKKSESEHDIFDSGHASNSISVALGLAIARDKKKTNETVVAVIGDGSLTGGMAYEALNQAGHLKTNLIVVLNDNAMSIAKNVGAMSSYLSRIRIDPTYNKLREEIEERIKKIPGVGEKIYALGEHVKESIKHLFVPGMIFEELGFKYIGPIDGHNIEVIATAISLAKQAKGPVLIHVLTQKGKGYPPAESYPDKFHGISPLAQENGELAKKEPLPTYTEVFGKTLIELAKKEEKIIGITAAMPGGTGIDIFAREFPDRFFDVGIAEQHAVTFAAGLALGGFIPVVAIYSTFLERAYDQIIQDIALQGLHIIFAIDRAGLVGEDGPTHHGAFDLSYLRHIPGLVIMAPKDENELRHMIYTATKLSGPVAIRYPRGAGLGVPLEKSFSLLEIGKWEKLREGKEVCLLAVGRMVELALKTGAILEQKKISTTIINSRFVKPLDEDTICKEALRHQLLVGMEENSLIGGFCSGVLDILNSRNIKTPFLPIGLPDSFVTHGSLKDLFEELGLTPEKVAQKIEDKLFSLHNKKRESFFSRFKVSKTLNL